MPTVGLSFCVIQESGCTTLCNTCVSSIGRNQSDASSAPAHLERSVNPAGLVKADQYRLFKVIRHAQGVARRECTSYFLSMLCSMAVRVKRGHNGYHRCSGRSLLFGLRQPYLQSAATQVDCAPLWHIRPRTSYHVRACVLCFAHKTRARSVTPGKNAKNGCLTLGKGLSHAASLPEEGR